MNVLKKAFVLVCVIAMVLTIVGCSSNSNSDSSGEGTMLIDGKNVAVSTLGNFGDYEVDFDLYSYIYLSNKASYDETALAEETTIEQLRETSMDTLKYAYAIEALFEENNLEMTEEDEQTIQGVIDYLVENYGGEEELQKVFDEMKLTMDAYKYQLKSSIYQQKLLEVYKDEIGDTTEIINDLKKDYARVYHILIESSDKNAQDLELAQSLLERAKNGEDFLALIQEYGEDPGMETKTEGYYFTYGEMVTEFEEASFALADNEISDIVETSYGYHIIKRYPMEDSYFEENLETMASDAYAAILDEKVYQQIDKMEFKPNEYYDLVTPESIV